MVSRKDVMDRLRRQREVELSNISPSERARIEGAGRGVRRTGGVVGGFIERRSVEGERTVKEGLRRGVKNLVFGDKSKRRRR